MSHSVYDNSPFDSNHDGHISAGEASFIHDTYHKDSNIGIKSGNRDHLNNHKRNTGNSGKNEKENSELGAYHKMVYCMEGYLTEYARKWAESQHKEYGDKYYQNEIDKRKILEASIKIKEDHE